MLADKPRSRTNHRERHGPHRKGPHNAVPALHKKQLVIVAGKDPRVLQELKPLVWDAQRPAKDECADGVRRNNYRNERQKRVVDEGSGVDRDLVETKQKGERRRHDRVQAEER